MRALRARPARVLSLTPAGVYTSGHPAFAAGPELALKEQSRGKQLGLCCPFSLDSMYAKGKACCSAGPEVIFVCVLSELLKDEVLM